MKDTGVGSKLENAKRYISESALKPDEVLFIGDLISDYEMARKLGSECILVPRGHTSFQRCKDTGATLMNTLYDIRTYLINNY